MNRLKLAIALLATALIAAAPASNDDAKLFGARDNIIDMSISPDGKALAVIQPELGRGAFLSIVRLDGTPQLKPILRSSGSPDRLSWCRWSTSTRLVCGIYMIDTVYGETAAATRLISLDADGGDSKMLSVPSNDRSLGVALGGGAVIDWQGDREGTVLMQHWYVPETTVGHLIAQRREGLGVDRVDTRTLQRSTVERPNAAAIGYITDGHGVVRVMGKEPHDNSGYSENRYDFFYRKKGSRDWSPLSTETFSGGISKGFAPVAVDPDLDVVYGFDSKDGRQALYKIALDGSLKKELVYARPDVDVDHLVRVGRQNRVVGVSWVTDKRETAMFDPALKQFGAALSKALPGEPLVSFVDASADENQLLLFAGSDVDPGRFYLFDKPTKKLTEILPIRPQLEKMKLAHMRPVSFPAADGSMIPGYLTLPPGSDGKNLPAIVLPHGGPWARDEWSFDWLPQYFAHRGFAVLQPTFRGSTGYGVSWFEQNGFRSWRTAIGDIDDGGRWLVKQGIADPRKMAIVGWSYGGYAALQSGVVAPGLFKAIVAVAPVTDFGRLRDEWKGDSSPQALDAIFGDAAVAEAGSPARHADAFAVPVLMFQGDRDQNVSIDESRLMKDRLQSAGKSVQLIEYNGLDHQLDDDGARADLLSRADAFLRASMHM